MLVEHKEPEMDGHKKMPKPVLSKRQPCSSTEGAWVLVRCGKSSVKIAEKYLHRHILPICAERRFVHVLIEEMLNGREKQRVTRVKLI